VSLLIVSAILWSLGGVLIKAIDWMPFFFPARQLATAWSWLAALGVFQLTLPYMLYARAIRNVRALDAALILVGLVILNRPRTVARSPAVNSG
jgi:hypothetical protein